MALQSIHKRKSDLLFICCQSPRFRKQLLVHADGELIRCICQCATKVLDGSIPITNEDKKKLKKYKRTLRQLREPQKTLSSKRRTIVQTGGGFLLSLIPAVVGALASLIR
jgi:hypothetical protein